MALFSRLAGLFSSSSKEASPKIKDERRNDGATVKVDHGIKEASTLVTIKMRIKHAETNVTDEMTETRFPEIKAQKTPGQSR